MGVFEIGPVVIPATGIVVTPTPALVGVLLVVVTEYIKPRSIITGHVPILVTFPFKMADFAVIAPTATVVTAPEDEAEAVPVKVLVGELLPEVVLDTVMVALLFPAEEGVKVTLKVAFPKAGTVVGASETTNSALSEDTVTPEAAELPEFDMVYVIVEAAVPGQTEPCAVVPVIARTGSGDDTTPTNLTSSILYCVVVPVCVNLILRLAVEGIVPVAVLYCQVDPAVPVPAVKVKIIGV